MDSVAVDDYEQRTLQLIQVGEYIYAIGSDQRHEWHTAERYHLGSRRWESLASLPVILNRPSIVSYYAKILNGEPPG